MTEFTAFPKIPRLFRDIVVTEKIDGTNAAVVITDIEALRQAGDYSTLNRVVHHPGIREGGLRQDWLVQAQSRKRLITPEMDNHGFAAWVWEHRRELIDALGPGVHFGEWWGNGIGRGYGLAKDDKRFSLFNAHRWAETEFTGALSNVATVPVIGRYTMDTEFVNSCLAQLAKHGSEAAPGFMRPEGVVVYHTQGNVMFKATLENDERGKEFGG